MSRLRSAAWASAIRAAKASRASISGRMPVSPGCAASSGARALPRKVSSVPVKADEGWRWTAAGSVEQAVRRSASESERKARRDRMPASVTGMRGRGLA
jgi:hypothetical protein